MRILIVEDEAVLARNIAAFLDAEGFDATVALDGDAGLELALEGGWALVLLDINLPRRDGFSVCETLRAEGSEVPVLMLTARVGPRDVIRGLDCGADDYLAKPFHLEVLLARVRALLRREGETRCPLITVDTNTRTVARGGETIHLAPREFALLEYLARHRGVAQDRTTIISRVWGEDDAMIFSQTVDVHVSYIRRKLGHAIIVTVPGTGYLVPAEA
jgi:two-component system copper resistance phosphate regulon response regulator CusR